MTILQNSCELESTLQSTNNSTVSTICFRAASQNPIGPILIFINVCFMKSFGDEDIPYKYKSVIFILIQLIVFILILVIAIALGLTQFCFRSFDIRITIILKLGSYTRIH